MDAQDVLQEDVMPYVKFTQEGFPEVHELKPKLHNRLTILLVDEANHMRM